MRIDLEEVVDDVVDTKIVEEVADIAQVQVLEVLVAVVVVAVTPVVVDIPSRPIVVAHPFVGSDSGVVHLNIQVQKHEDVVHGRWCTLTLTYTMTMKFCPVVAWYQVVSMVETQVVSKSYQSRGGRRGAGTSPAVGNGVSR